MIVVKDNIKVICSFDNKRYPSIWTVLNPNDNVEQKLYEAEHYYNNFPEYNREYEVMTLDEFKHKEVEQFNNSCREISYEEYDDMLCVLPPIYIDLDVDDKFHICNAFMVSEPLTSTYYDGVVHFRYKNKDYYATKIIDRFGKTVKFETSDLEKIVNKGGINENKSKN